MRLESNSQNYVCDFHIAPCEIDLEDAVPRSSRWRWDSLYQLHLRARKHLCFLPSFLLNAKSFEASRRKCCRVHRSVSSAHVHAGLGIDFTTGLNFITLMISESRSLQVNRPFIHYTLLVIYASFFISFVQ